MQSSKIEQIVVVFDFIFIYKQYFVHRTLCLPLSLSLYLCVCLLLSLPFLSRFNSTSFKKSWANPMHLFIAQSKNHQAAQTLCCNAHVCHSKLKVHWTWLTTVTPYIETKLSCFVILKNNINKYQNKHFHELSAPAKKNHTDLMDSSSIH